MKSYKILRFYFSLEKKKIGSEKMREALLSAEQLTDTTTYNKEHVITKRMFKNVKKDLV